MAKQSYLPYTPTIMKQFFARFRTLQWKLTLSYTWVTTAVTIFVLVFAIVIATSLFKSIIPNAATAFQPMIRPAARQIAPFLEQEPPDLAGLRGWLDSSQQGNEFQIDIQGNNIIGNGSVRFSDLVFTAIIDPNETILAFEPGNNLDQSVDTLLFPEAKSALANALTGETNPDLLTATNNETSEIFIAVPVFNQQDALLAALILLIDFPIDQSDLFSTGFIAGFFPLTLSIFLITGVAGTIFGFIASRGFSRRLHRLTKAAAAWSEGDFTTFVQDNSADEIGQLAQRLNLMAEQLQNMVQTRTELATLEERNRLARDLHDSVKQQVFATAMQLGAAQAMIDSDPAAAKVHLGEAKQLAQQAQRELTGLIQELRPAALEGKGLVEAVRDFAQDWSRRTSIPVEVTVSGEKQLPLLVEQPLFRVVQAALANVARHSGAQNVTIHLAWQTADFTMSIADDGKGFDVTETGYGMGLHSMQERLAQLNGRLAIHSSPGQGTSLTATLPI